MATPFSEIVDPTRSDFESTRIRDLFDYWSSKRQNPQGLVSRRDIDIPVDLPMLARIITIADVPNANLLETMRFRLAGTEVTSWMKKDITGLLVRTLYNDKDWAVLAGQLRKTILHEAPCLSRQRVEFVELQEPLIAERLLLPVTLSGERVDQVIAATNFEPAEDEKSVGPSTLLSRNTRMKETTPAGRL